MTVRAGHAGLLVSAGIVHAVVRYRVRGRLADGGGEGAAPRDERVGEAVAEVAVVRVGDGFRAADVVGGCGAGGVGWCDEVGLGGEGEGRADGDVEGEEGGGGGCHFEWSEWWVGWLVVCWMRVRMRMDG